MAVHVSPAFRVELGDVVTVGECSYSVDPTRN
jgi:ribosomal protein S17